MGFASFLEDITDRYIEDGGGLDPRDERRGPKPKPKPKGTQATRSAPSDPMDRPRRIIRDFWKFYHSRKSLAEGPTGYWEQHFANITALHDILAPAADVDEATPGSWDILCGVEARLRAFLHQAGDYGPLSRKVIQRVTEISKEIKSRCEAVERELKRFHQQANKPRQRQPNAEIVQALQEFEEIRGRLDADLAERRRYDQLAEQVKEWFDYFVALFTRLAVQSRYRPALKDMHRLRLNEQQEGFVALNHGAAYRIQGTSGCGKSIILIHRALRLALENPTSVVRLFTINRSLAELLRESVTALNGSVPANLQVAAFYDFLVEIIGVSGGASEYRLVDDRSGERIADSWRDFYHHRGTSPTENIFATKAVRNLIHSIESRERLQVDASRYLRDEMIYAQSAYRSHERLQYLTDPRVGRSVGLLERARRTCLKVLDAWEEWLRFGELCDVDGLTLRVADLVADGELLNRVRTAFPTQHVLLDEVQDFSTLELDIVRRLVADPDGPNRFFFVGDIQQKVFPKQHQTLRVGDDFTGRARTLARNYRNTQQILQAASCIPEHFPPCGDEPLDVAAAELSQFVGGEPVCLGCTRDNHIQPVLEMVRNRRGVRVAVVSENEELLAAVRQEARRLKLKCYALFRVEDLDRWEKQSNDVLAADLVISRLEAVKGFEFDTVIACDLSDGVIPRLGTPPEEYWREAAVVYSALTRARDELIMTFVGEPSIFLKTMAGHIATHENLDSRKLSEILQGAEVSKSQRCARAEVSLQHSATFFPIPPLATCGIALYRNPVAVPRTTN